MNIHKPIDPTPGEIEFARAFQAPRPGLPGGAALAALRDAAFARLQATGLPHRLIEAWHYTDLRRLLKFDFAPAAVEANAGFNQVMQSAGASAFSDLSPARLMFVDGRFAPEYSDLDGLGEGVEVKVLSHADMPDWALDEIANRRPAGDNAIFDMNLALAQDGALIRVAGGAASPIHLHSVGANGAWPVLRHVVVVEAAAKLTLIETHGGDAAFTSAAMSMDIGAGAQVNHVKVQDIAATATHLAPSVVELSDEVIFNSFTLSLGAGLAREERHVRFAGDGTDGNISGAYLLAGSQHCDTTLVVDHIGRGCTSRELYKGIVDDRAHGVFQGQLNVAPGAQKTDARQSVDVLLLSDEAVHDAKPELEIYADDVQCGHGATTGELDGEMMFYLQSRGIGRAQAEAMLISAFITGAIDIIADQPLRDAVGAIAARRLDARHLETGGA
ncbi:MAG: Fe-S cluster assembly protein SufD [Hyphomicrobiales bacterium]